MAVALLVASIGFYCTWYRPAKRQLSTLRATMRQQQDQLAANQAQLRNLPALQADVYRLQARLEHNNKTLPHQPELAAVMKDLNALGQQSAVRKFTCQPGPMQKQQGVSEVPMAMNFEGDFMSVYQFLRQSEDMLRLTRVRELKIRATDPKTGQVDVQMALNVYFSEE
jgi:Tfp pilus assembly protein PilO